MNIDYRPGSFTVVDASGREAAFDGDQYKWEITDGMLIVNAITTEGQGAMPYEVTELREIYAGSWRLSLG
ncbi:MULTISPECIES: hypothetical protein [Gordonia]|uniref:hypothetical protein n=1 Tax=Gordonia TaxID=2053 RepID=UPI0007E9D641|nr:MULTISPECIES: hypothetical protein [Gordonia]MCM3893877.1 hypothetical protein [Gordonia sputi]OBA32896.1 hypothetical protein A5766_12620 [Gordonia sp. 852002-51296_SCH5728562-b]OBA74004.1 hypothetical protein A5777_09630 [Gordonia sp. 852002-10350_SCH5691597]